MSERTKNTPPTGTVPILFLTLKQTRQRLGLSYDAVRRMVNSGRLAAVRVSGWEQRVPVREIDALMRGGTEEPHEVSAQMLTTEQAAECLAIAYRTCLRMLGRGDLPSEWINARERRVPLSGIENVITAAMAKSAAVRAQHPRRSAA